MEKIPSRTIKISKATASFLKIPCDNAQDREWANQVITTLMQEQGLSSFPQVMLFLLERSGDLGPTIDKLHETGTCSPTTHATWASTKTSALFTLEGPAPRPYFLLFGLPRQPTWALKIVSLALKLRIRHHLHLRITWLPFVGPPRVPNMDTHQFLGIQADHLSSIIEHPTPVYSKQDYLTPLQSWKPTKSKRTPASSFRVSIVLAWSRCSLYWRWSPCWWFKSRYFRYYRIICYSW